MTCFLVGWSVPVLHPGWLKYAVGSAVRGGGQVVGVACRQTPSCLAAALGLGELCLHTLQPKRQLIALFAQLLVLSLQLVHIHAGRRAKRHLDEAARDSYSVRV